LDRIKIAIAADGGTDFQVFKFLIEKYIIFDTDIEFTFLRRCPRGSDLLNDWWKAGQNELEWKNKVAEKFHRALISAYQEWNEKSEGISCRDYLIYHLDSERLAKNVEDIIKGWAREVIESLWRGIDLFYFRYGKICGNLLYLPKVIPVLLFPSTDILGAIYAGISDYREKQPSNIKKELYGTSDLFRLNEEEFKQKLEAIFLGDRKDFLRYMRDVPEIYRILLIIK
jgi:hypothetical protein